MVRGTGSDFLYMLMLASVFVRLTLLYERYGALSFSGVCYSIFSPLADTLQSAECK